MASAGYYRWVAAGRPWELATPVKQLQDMARAAGVPILGTIGNDQHLLSNNPQDHTPFPLNPWPVALPGYWVCAIDLADGPWSDRMLAYAKAGVAPWIKYLNFRGKHYDIRDGWSATTSSDQHLHVSIRSDFRTYSAVSNPFGIDMADDLNGPNGLHLIWRVQGIADAMDTWHPGAPPILAGKPNPFIKLIKDNHKATLAAVAAVAKDPIEVSDELVERIADLVADRVAAKVLAGMEQAAFNAAQRAEKE